MMHTVKFSTLFLLLLSMASAAQNQKENLITLESLGQLQLNFNTIELVKRHQGRSVKAEVSYKAREAYKLVAPFRAQSVQILVENGAYIQKNTPVLVLSGSEIHHFLEMHEAKKALYELSTLRYENNKKLFKQKSISSDKWTAITTDYYQSKIDYGHLRHFNELIESIIHEDSIVIKSPIEGFFLLPDGVSNDPEVMQLGQILPRESLKLTAQVSAVIAENVESVTTSSCTLSIEHTDQVSTGYFVTLWSEALPETCHLLLGQKLQATPNIISDAYLVPQSSVFNWHRSSYILIKQDNNLVPIVVDIISSDMNGYLIDSTQDLSSKQVLSSSVSAVHGILLGMGGE